MKFKGPHFIIAATDIMVDAMCVVVYGISKKMDVSWLKRFSGESKLGHTHPVAVASHRSEHVS